MGRRGWDYVSCIETVATQGSLHGVDDCWRMSSSCRDIFQSASTATAVPFPISIGLASGAGTLAACLIALAVRGDLFRWLSRSPRDALDHNVQFAPVVDADLD
jgi:hypothetical protein